MEIAFDHNSIQFILMAYRLYYKALFYEKKYIIKVHFMCKQLIMSKRCFR